MSTQKLGVKQLAFALAIDEMKCELCGNRIAPGTPYAVKAKYILDGGEYVLEKTIECMSTCSARRATKIKEEPTEKVKPVILHPSVADLPDFATEAEKNLKIITHRDQIQVAIGYIKIVEFEIKGKQNCRMECSEEQILRRAFTAAPEYADRFDRFKTYQTADGMRAREYLKDDGPYRAEHWYLPLEFLAAVPKVQFAIAKESK